MADYSEDYLLDKRVKIFQPLNGYRASTDAVLLAAFVCHVKKGDNILDVGSGTGAISLCLSERFKNKEISIRGLEIQPELARLADLSAQVNHFHFLEFIHTNIFDYKTDFCSFAHVVSNPPYSENDMPSPNLSKATAHNFVKADLEKWIAFCIKMIKPQGFFYTVNRAEALEDLLCLLHGKLGGIEVFPLYSKSGQDAKRILLRARKDSKAPLILRSPIVLHQEDGTYTAEAQRILRGGEGWD